MIGKKNQNQARVKKKNPERVNLLSKITLSVLVIAFIGFIYLVTIVTTSPKSIPLLTKKIESELQKTFGSNLKVKDSLVSFTKYGSLKFTIRNLDFSKQSNLVQSQQDKFFIGSLQAEISLLDLLTFRFRPQKIKAAKSEILIHSETASESEKNPQNIAKFDLAKIAGLIGSLSAIKVNNFPLENFEIEDAKILLKSRDSQKSLIIKRSQIKSSTKGGFLSISSFNKLSFAELEKDLEFKANCQTQELQSMRCEILVENIVADSIAKFHPKVAFLNQINASININASVLLKAGALKSVNFKIDSKAGDFSFLEFFEKKIKFSNLSILGNYDHEIGVLNLSQITADFLENSGSAKFEMALEISGLNNLEKRKMDFAINLKDVPNSSLASYWPIALSDNGIRDWVLGHIKNGVIQSAKTKFSLLLDKDNFVLDKIVASLTFSGFDLTYSDYFPKITNISGVADFTEKNMIIALKDGEVLNSKIKDSRVVIEDFSDEKIFLKISGQSYGNSADSLKHADYQSDFAKYLSKYLNGNSKNTFEIKVPLVDDLDLSKTYITVNSEITNLKNDFVSGATTIAAKKDFQSNVFATKIDLTNADLTIKAFDIEKKNGDLASLDLAVAVLDKKIELKEISLTKKEKNLDLKKSKNRENIAKIMGNAKFEIAPFALEEIRFFNRGFGKNDYDFSYKVNHEKSLGELAIKAKKIDTNSFFANKAFFFGLPSSDLSSFSASIEAASVKILSGKNLSNLKFSLFCNGSFCSKISAHANYAKGNFFDIKTLKNPESKGSIIKARITDIGYLSEGFGVSKVISGGDLKFLGKTFLVDGSQAILGEVKIDSGITIYDNYSVKRLEKDTLFSQVKDKIFSSEKTKFDSVKIDLELRKSDLKINSLVANNYKIGVTAKGAINLKSETYAIKGMIVPGFIINNLFGIGNIPIIGGVISGILTGGEGGGVFGIKYEYIKNKGDKEGRLTTNKVSSFVPSTIQNLFD